MTNYVEVRKSIVRSSQHFPVPFSSSCFTFLWSPSCTDPSSGTPTLKPSDRTVSFHRSMPSYREKHYSCMMTKLLYQHSPTSFQIDKMSMGASGRSNPLCFRPVQLRCSLPVPAKALTFWSGCTCRSGLGSGYCMLPPVP